MRGVLHRVRIRLAALMGVHIMLSVVVWLEKDATFCRSCQDVNDSSPMWCCVMQGVISRALRSLDI